MNIGSCSAVSNLLVDLCFASRNDLSNSKDNEKGFSLNPVSAKQLDDFALRDCFSRAVSKAFFCLGDSEQSLQQSIFRRFQAHVFFDALMQDKKDNNSGALSFYV